MLAVEFARFLGLEFSGRANITDIVNAVCDQSHLWGRRWVGSRRWGRGSDRGAVRGGGFDDSDVEVVDEDQGAGSGVGSADADVVQAAGHAQRDGAGLIDAVGADAVVGVGAGAGVCFGSGLVGRGSVGQ
jgi:hypothetical protein